MKTIILPLAFSFLVTCLGAFHVEAATYYVSASGTNPVLPYASWNTAATNIQDAANLAGSGDTILVTNGVYQYGGASFDGSNRVYMARGVLLQSINGPAYTTIQGYWVPGTTNGNNAVRCVYVSPYATISGFTLTNGATQGGEGNGGGVFLQANGTVTNCVIVGNAAGNEGGGCWSDQNAIMTSCIISNNIAPNGSGIEGGTVYNSLIVGNGNTNSGSAASFSKLYNCTISGNTASGLGAAQGCTLINSIIYDNTNGQYADCYQCLLTNCCTTLGLGNSTLPNNSISNTPVFVNPSAGNYRLQIGSPCIDAGNDLYVTNATDLDENPRIVGASVDMGCYENQNTNEVLYVSVSSTNPVAPYTNWLTAATNIQDAVGVAQAGDIVVAGSGLYKNGGAMVYGSSNRVALTNAITLLGIYGPQTTAIVGSPFGAVSTRCAYVSSNAFLSGFSLVDGAASTSGNAITNESGGGAWCEIGGVISNCVFGGTNFPYVNASTPSDGCSAAIAGGGDYGGTIYNSIFANNIASGGGAVAEANLINCLITNNISRGSKAFPGIDLCTASNCTIVDNNGTGAEQSTLYDCMIASNSPGAELSALYSCTVAGNQNGGTIQCTNYGCVLAGNTNYDGGGANGGVLYNCLVAFNVASNASSPYGLGGGVYEAQIYNCTVVSNSATGDGGGTYAGNALNSIIFFNTVAGAAQNVADGTQLGYCCVSPAVPMAYNSWSITNDPMFVNPAAGDFHLQYNSPCINAGDNAYVSTTNDLDGNPRIVGYAVDMGAYEKSPASIIPNWWLFEYGLTNDGSADNADSDGIGMPNWEKWKAGLNPTNSASVLAMSPPAPSSIASGVTVTWQSVTDIVYYVQQSTNLSAQPAFYPIQSNIVGQAGTTSFTDTTATNAGPYFYRVGVQ